VLYDAAYLAVAEISAGEMGASCEFWTADERRFEQVKQRKQYVRLLG